MATAVPEGKAASALVRYVDDFIIMCRKDVEESLKVVRHVLERLDLSLNETKTHIVDRYSSVAMGKVRQRAEDRLRNHLMKRHKVRDRKAALCRFPRRDLYERYGL